MSDDTPWGSPRPGDAPKPDKDAPASDPLKEAREAWSTPAPFIKSGVPESAETAQRTFDEAAEKVKEAAKKVTRKVGARKKATRKKTAKKKKKAVKKKVAKKKGVRKKATRKKAAARRGKKKTVKRKGAKKKKAKKK